MTVTKMYICATPVKEIEEITFIPEFIKDLIGTGISVNTSYKTTVQKDKEREFNSTHIGSKTECALLGLAEALGVDYVAIRSKYPMEKFAKIYPFSSTKKRLSTVIDVPGVGFRVYSSGAPEFLVENCSFIFGKDGILEPFTLEMKTRFLKTVAEPMASKGLRTICLAYREFVKSGSPKPNQTLFTGDVDWNREADVVRNLTLIAIFGMEDPIRPEVPAAIKDCHCAGIRVCMITGDSVNTAETVAIKSGIIEAGDDSLVLEIDEFKKMVYTKGKFQQELFDKIWPDLKVLARMTPNDKYVVINGIRNSKIHPHEEVVAVTGDGSNDVPALLRADVGFSMVALFINKYYLSLNVF